MRKGAACGMCTEHKFLQVDWTPTNAHIQTYTRNLYEPHKFVGSLPHHNSGYARASPRQLVGERWKELIGQLLLVMDRQFGQNLPWGISQEIGYGV